MSKKQRDKLRIFAEREGTFIMDSASLLPILDRIDTLETERIALDRSVSHNADCWRKCEKWAEREKSRAEKAEFKLDAILNLLKKV